MVKFSKELEAQLIPEWRDYFVNYWQLKKHVKKIKFSRKPKQSSQIFNNSSLGYSIFDPIRSLMSSLSSRFQTTPAATTTATTNDEVEESKSTDGQDNQTEFQDSELSQLFSEEDEVLIDYLGHV